MPITLGTYLYTLALVAASPPAADQAQSSTTTAEAKSTKSTSNARESDRWIERWAPEREILEFGLYGGIYLPGQNHELFEPNMELENQGFRRLARLGPDFGARIAYFPLAWLGAELEGGVMPTSTSNDRSAFVWTARGSAVFQVPKWSVVPFVLAGPGALGITSSRDGVGNDVDPALHFGGGLKLNLNEHAQIRLDLRDVVSYKTQVSNVFRGHNFEALLGLSITLGRETREEAPVVCEATETVLDRDGDGIIDSRDQCVAEYGPVTNNGCPVLTAVVEDKDGDGIADGADSCIDQPESKNGYHDADGCPDEVPEEVAEFSGVFEGIFFDSSSDIIKQESFARMQKAIDILKKYGDIRVEISGHTDSSGDPRFNDDLSHRRAESVKRYLSQNGIEQERMVTMGAGSSRPIANNATRVGRSRNRRIEFKILK